MPVMNLLPPAPDTNEPAARAPGMPVWALREGKVTETEALIGCNFKGAPAARSYRVELQTVGIDAKGGPVALWEPFTRTALQEKGTMVAAQMLNLQPGRLYVVRLVGLDGQGKVIESSSVGRVWTVAAKSGGGWRWWVSAAAAGGGYWFWRTRGSRVRGSGVRGSGVRGSGGRGWT